MLLSKVQAEHVPLELELEAISILVVQPSSFWAEKGQLLGELPHFSLRTKSAPAGHSLIQTLLSSSPKNSNSPLPYSEYYSFPWPYHPHSL